MTISENPDLEVVLTVKEAATVCGVSPKTIRRRLEKGLFPNAYRETLPNPSPHPDAPALEGRWFIPTADLLASGLSFSAPKPAQPLPVSAASIEAPASTDSAQLEKLKADNAALATELAHTKELLTLTGASLDDARLALRALTAGPPVSEPRARRGWFRR